MEILQAAKICQYLHFLLIWKFLDVNVTKINDKNKIK